ncbi:MAG: GAF domain-containing protein [Ignavibacteria bacterium]
MSFELKTSENLSKEKKYQLLLSQIKSITDGEKNFISNLANITSALKYSFEDFIWVGFYLKENNELVLGPFQGRVACTRIPFGKGVCGTAAAKKETIIIDDVNNFPGHIVCDSLSKSEIVIPIVIGKEVEGVLDIDSGKLNNFDETDKNFLEQLIENISYLFQENK